jgi:hypothetical protein
LLPFGPEQTYVGEQPWQPLDIDVRASSQAALRVEGEGVSLDASATCDGDGRVLTMTGAGEIALRFLSPLVTAAETSGGATELGRETIDGTLSLRLQLDGDAEVRAK